MRIQKDTPIKLKTFLGTLSPLEDVIESENYWKLIGARGTVISADAINSERVLVLFERNLNDLGLEHHNPVDNSLWIKKSDLEFTVYD